MMKETSRASKLTLWLSFGVLGAAIIAALTIFFLPSDNSTDTPDAADTAAPAPASSTPTAGAGGIGCEAPPSDHREVPDDLRWEAANGVTWPVSDTVGPTKTENGFSACFEHSPIGAALAATAMTFSTTEQTQLDTFKFYLADSPGRDVALASTSPGTYSSIKEQIQDNGLALVGFKIEEYDSDRASVRLVLRVPGSPTGFRGVPSPMVWVDGDWKLKPLDDGTTGQPSDEGSSDFTNWTAVGNG
jgi:hypothetical protein